MKLALQTFCDGFKKCINPLRTWLRKYVFNENAAYRIFFYFILAPLLFIVAYISVMTIMLLKGEQNWSSMASTDFYQVFPENLAVIADYIAGTWGTVILSLSVMLFLISLRIQSREMSTTSRSRARS